MKKTLLFCCSILFPLLLNGQIDPFLGIYELESCPLEPEPCDYIQLDTLDNQLWQLGTPVKPFFDTAYNAPNAILTDTVFPYDTTRREFFEFIYPLVDNPEGYYGNLIFGFRHKFQTDSLIDGGYVMTSIDGGVSWFNVIDTYEIQGDIYHFGTENFYNDADTLYDGSRGFSGTSDGWVHSRIQWVWDLPVVRSPLSPPDTLRLRFFFLSDSIQTNKDGWMIDDIQLYFANVGSSVNNYDNPIETQLTPNPFSGSAVLSFEHPNEGPLQLYIIDITGKTLQVINNIRENQVLIKQNKLYPGLYFYQLKDTLGKTLGGGKMVIR